jgi:Type IV secretion system pilin
MRIVMKYFLGIGSLLLLLFVFLPVDTALAQQATSSFVTCSGTNCSACNLVEMVNAIIVWLFGIIFLIFATLMVVAGFGLVTSGGNQAALSAAKSKFTNAIIGLLIVMAAWLLVDTVMRQLVKGDGNLGETGAGFKGFGPWSEVQCLQQTKTILPNPQLSAAATGFYNYQVFVYDATNKCKVGKSATFTTLALCDSSLSALQSQPGDKYITDICSDAPVSVTEPLWATSPICATPPVAGADEFTYQGNVRAQLVHASPQLSSLITCMASKVPANVGDVSSISDQSIIAGNKTWAQCRLGGCAHTTNSDHYGNDGRCGDKSYAIDFGDEQNIVALCNAANSCGSVRNCSIHNGNHVHVSLNISC